MQDLFIGLDFGSDSVRALVVDKQGCTLATAVDNYRRWSQQLYCNAASHQFRQHPLDHLESMEFVLKSVLQNVDRTFVRGIAVDTTASTPCAVDSDNVPLAMHEKFADDPDGMFVLWKDHTAIAEEQRINQVAANWQIDYRKYSGSSYSCEWFWSKVLHVLKNNSAVRNAAHSFVEHCDWISGVLTGCTDPALLRRSRCAAGHKAMWNSEWNGLPPENFLTAVDPLLGNIRNRLYTQTFTVGEVAGNLSSYWAERLGLSTEVIIGIGAVDCHVGAIGAGIRPGEMVKVLGTSTCDILAAPDPGFCIEGICGQVDGSVLPGMTGFEAGQSAFGDIYNWFKNFLSYAGKVDIAQLEADAAALPPESSQVIALDWFNGRRTPYADSMLSGVLANLNLGSTPPMVYRALVESTVMGSKAIFEHYLQAGIKINGITAVGGISYKSNYIMQMIADALNMPVKVAKTDQACALGAAMTAAAAAGYYNSVEAASQAMQSGFRKIYTPDPAKHEHCRKLYTKYRKLGAVWSDFLHS